MSEKNKEVINVCPKCGDKDFIDAYLPKQVRTCLNCGYDQMV
jgi:uncharacterized protein (DUF983 family)